MELISIELTYRETVLTEKKSLKLFQQTAICKFQFLLEVNLSLTVKL